VTRARDRALAVAVVAIAALAADAAANPF